MVQLPLTKLHFAPLSESDGKRALFVYIMLLLTLASGILVSTSVDIVPLAFDISLPLISRTIIIN